VVIPIGNLLANVSVIYHHLQMIVQRMVQIWGMTNIIIIFLWEYLVMMHGIVMVNQHIMDFVIATIWVQVEDVKAVNVEMGAVLTGRAFNNL
jgi:hypothetical protein